MAQLDRRAEEIAALDAICQVEEISRHEWLPETNGRTPDLRLELADGRTVFAEVTLATRRADRELRGAAKKMQPYRDARLRFEWQVAIADEHSDERARRGRRLKALVAALSMALARVESQGGSPEMMMRRAFAVLDPAPYHPHLSSSGGPMRQWALECPRDKSLEEWLRHDYMPVCDYWYPPDIEDLLLHDLEPREARVLSPPATPREGTIGGIYVHTMTTESGFMAGGADHLVPVIRNAIEKKQDWGQLRNVDGDRWLVVVLDVLNALGQLEEACEPDMPSSAPELGGVEFSEVDEVWALGKTFHGERLTIARFANSGSQPELLTVPNLRRR
ncbi:hypothetical protein [Candidatus Poriferisodalis sp.]|uniref:hypothetical protein n=1 Tax=Candidatus Poriferisodalis sp. TaxID=3101277 RepID=UPI003B017190